MLDFQSCDIFNPCLEKITKKKKAKQQQQQQQHQKQQKTKQITTK